MKTIKTTRIIEFGKMNKNKRVYLKDNMKDIPKEVPLYDKPADEKGSKKIGKSKIKVTDKGIFATSSISKKHNKLVELIESGKLHPVSSGMGEFNDKGEVTDFKMTSVFLTDKPA